MPPIIHTVRFDTKRPIISWPGPCLPLCLNEFISFITVYKVHHLQIPFASLVVNVSYLAIDSSIYQWGIVKASDGRLQYKAEMGLK